MARPHRSEAAIFFTPKGPISDLPDPIDKINDRQTSTRVGDHRGILDVVRFSPFAETISTIFVGNKTEAFMMFI
jgi:hypothetical protein